MVGQVAQKKIAIVANQDTVEYENEVVTGLLRRDSVWEWIQFSESIRKNLPCEKAHLNASAHLDESQHGQTARSSLFQTILSMMTKDTELCYLGAPTVLLKTVASRILDKYNSRKDLPEKMAIKSPF